MYIERVGDAALFFYYYYYYYYYCFYFYFYFYFFFFETHEAGVVFLSLSYGSLICFLLHFPAFLSSSLVIQHTALATSKERQKALIPWGESVI